MGLLPWIQFMWPLPLPLELQPWVSFYRLDISTFLTHKYLKLSITKPVFIIFYKGPSSQGYGFSSGHVWMWESDCEESWAPKN